MSLPGGTRIGPYEVVDLLAAGGMGEVYRARDTRLDRLVAVKVLPAIHAEAPGRLERFAREGRACASINHPNIVAVYDVCLDGETPYIVSELLEGETLRDALTPDQPWPVSRTLDVATQIAAGLAAAHDRGLVHRDLKPENIFLCGDGVVKILDFGLARLTESESGMSTDRLESLTREHTVVGTSGYMAPEQVLGGPVDHRADLFAFGAVLYELLTGRRAFQRGTPAATMMAIVTADPPPVTSVRDSLPAAVVRIVHRCLDKRPDHRFQSAADLVFALQQVRSPDAVFSLPSKWWAGGLGLAQRTTRVAAAVLVLAVAAVPGAMHLSRTRDASTIRPATSAIRSMAVLPFRAVSREPDDELLAEAMTDGLIAELSRAGALKVISRTSSNQYAGSLKPLPTIAKELDVQAIVEGSVLRQGDDLRVAVRLIEASTDQGRWSGTFDAGFDHVLDLQRDIAGRIAREIAVSIGAPGDARRAGAGRGEAEAVRLYLMGRRFLNSRWQASSWLKHWEDARLAFEGALAVDPTYAQAYAGLAELYTFAAAYGSLPPAVAYARAEIAARRALELDESLAEVHAALGMIRLSRDWDWSASQQAFERAVRLQPNAVDTLVLYALYLRSVGRQAEAVAQRERALELDPLRVHSRNLLAGELLFARRFEDAAVQLRKSLEIDPTSEAAHAGLGACYEHLGRHDLAAQHWTLALRHGGRPDLAERFGRLSRSRGYTNARRFLDRSLLDEELGKAQPDPWMVAFTYARLGNRGAAFSWLERAYVVRDPGLLQLRVDPDFDSLRSDPRYRDLVTRIGFPE